MNTVFLAGQRANFQLGRKSKLSNAPPKRLYLKVHDYVFKVPSRSNSVSPVWPKASEFVKVQILNRSASEEKPTREI